MRITRFSVAKKDIVSYFENYGKRVFSYADISKILSDHRNNWRLPAYLTTNKFIDSMIAYTKLKRYKVSFPGITITKFTWGQVTPLTQAINLKSNSYFSHYTALFLHGLTEQIPKSIYLTSELSQNSLVNNKLSQNSIDKAFLNQPRTSNNSAKLEDFKIFLLYGKFTNRLGIIEMTTTQDENIIVTDLERTLIDIVVRPMYSGGIYEVLQAYKKAADRVSINKLTAMLQKLSYSYPYHQSIGFILEKTGMYKESQVQLLKKFDIKYDFYLSYAIKNAQYSKEWKLYYPKGF
jgi:predicted transcriptional regulator of viral defense system